MPTSLPTRELGTTGMNLTRVGFGSWALGGGNWVSAWGPQDDDESVSAIRHAVESGVNWIDTAAVYGFGHSEEVVAKALASYSDADRPYVFTKGGLVWDADNPRLPSRRVGEAASLRSGVDGSLRRLGVDSIDLYFVHWPAADGTPVEEYWQTLADLRASGKLRAIGLSNHTPEDLVRAAAVSRVDAIQPPFSAINAAAAQELLPYCASHGIGAVVYSPMGSGLLTGAFSRERLSTLPEDDWRAHSPLFTTDLEANLAVADAMAAVARDHGVTTAAVAVAWTLGFDGVTGAIVGARSARQVDDWIGAAAVELSSEDYARIDAARAAPMR